MFKMKREKIYKMSIISIIILSLLLIGSLFLNYINEINRTINNVEGAWLIVYLIIIRVSLLSIMAFYIFHKWFSQEQLFFSDLPFLFGSFFLILIFGKFMDLLFDLTFFTLPADDVLFLLKIRFFIAILTLFPMMYLSIGMILFAFSLGEKYKKLKNKGFRNKIRNVLLIIVTIIEILAVIFAPNTIVIGILLPLFVLPSITTIVWLFYFSWKNKALSQVNTKLLSFAFGMLLISQLLRPITQNFVGEGALYIIIVEIIDFFVFVLIFIGFYLESHYTD